MNINPILLADSYKYSQPPQYVPGMTFMSAYQEARGGKTKCIVWTGPQYIIAEYLGMTVTAEHVDEAEEILTAHGEPFDRKGWMRVVEVHNGKIPVKVYSLPEGIVVPTGYPTLVVESADEEIPWMAGWTETLLLKTWYPSSVATKAAYVRKELELFLQSTSDNAESIVEFMYHNFGDRGSACVEAAAVGGFAHTIPFKGTDNTHSLKFAKDYYLARAVHAFSIPASEHSTTCSWGKAKEKNMVMSHIEKNKKRAAVAFVADTYNVFNMVDEVTSGEFKEKIESDDYPRVIIRPDSGDPIKVLTKLVAIMMANGIEWYTNSKGLKVFKNYGLLWGDGVTPKVILEILVAMRALKLAPDNFAFGSGGDLMQNVNRDTHKYAIKGSFVIANGVGYGISKDPITDPGKKSKEGRVFSKTDFEGNWSIVDTPEDSSMNCIYNIGLQSKELQSINDLREMYCNTKKYL